jgi:hypothetical protein
MSKWYRRREELTGRVVRAIGVDTVIWSMLKEKIHVDDLRKLSTSLCTELESEEEAMQLLTTTVYEECGSPEGAERIN